MFKINEILHYMGFQEKTKEDGTIYYLIYYAGENAFSFSTYAKCSINDFKELERFSQVEVELQLNVGKFNNLQTLSIKAI